MAVLYFAIFIICVLLTAWFMRRRERMEDKNPIFGPKRVDREKCERVYPDMYGPVKDGWGRNYLKVSQDEEDAKYPDNGEFQSNTATKNAAYMNVFTYPAYTAPDFPTTNGPPEPYLNDFSGLHR